jgi:hypothetical protein
VAATSAAFRAALAVSVPVAGFCADVRMTTNEETARIENKTAKIDRLDLVDGKLLRETPAELFFDIIVIRTYSPLKIPNQTIASLTHRPVLVEQVISENPF